MSGTCACVWCKSISCTPLRHLSTLEAMHSADFEARARQLPDSARVAQASDLMERFATQLGLSDGSSSGSGDDASTTSSSSGGSSGDGAEPAA